ncbi:Os04g0295200 [Oryza sativa Japonica Group]|uniref:Os04g0295200 protein n=1 Tax=Oryza sativa subsp. japonica TaxID=39947 RepID=A0A0N7KIS6_ORYSJ|nr:Os04g0295200 [Oryza sativa Japonica Group]
MSPTTTWALPPSPPPLSVRARDLRGGGCPAKATVTATPDALSSPSPPQPSTTASAPLPLSLLFPHLFPVHESDRREAAVPVVAADKAHAAGEEGVCDSRCTPSSPRRGNGTRRMARPWRS